MPMKPFLSYTDMYNVFTIYLKIFVICFAYLGTWQINCLQCIRFVCQKYKQIETFNNCIPSIRGVCPNYMPPLR